MVGEKHKNTDFLFTENPEILANIHWFHPLWERGLLRRTQNIMSNKDWLWVPGHTHGLVFLSFLLVLAHVSRESSNIWISAIALSIKRETIREGLRLYVHPHFSQWQWAEHSRRTFRCWYSWICCPPPLLIKPRVWMYLWQSVMGLLLACYFTGMTHEVEHARVL